MRPTLLVATALLLLNVAVAKAADPIGLAETGAFLLGNAHRCGVPTARVERAGKVIHHLIVAASSDPTEEDTAASRFAEIFMASAYPRSRCSRCTKEKIPGKGSAVESRTKVSPGGCG